MWKPYPREISSRLLAPKGSHYPTHFIMVSQHDDDIYIVCIQRVDGSRHQFIANCSNFMKAFAIMKYVIDTVTVKSDHGYRIKLHVYEGNQPPRDSENV